MNFGDLLFPTDFSAASTSAGLVAREMALQLGTRFHIVHVVPPVTDPADSRQRLARLASELGEGLRVETALLSGRVAHQKIIQYARDKGIGVIVLGTHGRTGVSRVLLGSVAESVVRLAPCPVLTVPAAAAEAAPSRTVVDEPSAPRRCIVCAQETEDLVCEACRTRVRGEVLHQRRTSEGLGHRGPAL